MEMFKKSGKLSFKLFCYIKSKCNEFYYDVDEKRLELLDFIPKLMRHIVKLWVLKPHQSTVSVYKLTTKANHQNFNIRVAHFGCHDILI